MKRRHFLFLSSAAALASFVPRAFAQSATVRITYVKSWPDSNLNTNIAAHILREHLGQTVELINTDAGPMWAAVATGRADATLTAWLPTTHQVYWERYKDQVINLGPITEGTWLGLAVPDYVPIDSIEELDAHADRFGRRIVGIEAGAGIMINTQEAIEAYSIKNLRLINSSTPAMQAELARAVARKQWIVVTAWTPLGIWARFPLKQLADPKNIYGEQGHIDAVIHPNLQERSPETVEFLRRYKMPLDELQRMMLALDEGKALEAVTQEWLDRNRATIEQWVAETQAAVG
ncbi:MAG: glycine betaine ABC transporter substrate-binding protein [Tepidiphilus sp.]|jgi:glycine betaine/proline transport system substrate-binding protein|uniref:glycine betaine ABC transporter substrate-binding protein n=1 Tax=Tepidiphilus succinatimandens TaxID=224436 RepID=UPI00112F311F|nr:glycine betaine ABC transporter substrate-binding protein [Tepidiphilus succinatimandens]MDD2407698.1 glycine betaine ABC transporter substrate-binding protein [Tepidiphilus sp.]MDD3432935.1 glycine betaine ABC transporter substrate-binding protein [Tepidiphilus sp.]MDK2798012.1 glycine betaine/proline transport system substrate-binding protein [Tepidiphilus sp.]